MPNRPNTFFKYMTVEVTKIVLVNHQLRWSSPLLFNDPFDVQRDFNLGFDPEELKEPLVNEIMNLVSAKQIPDISSHPHVEQLIKWLRREDDADMRNKKLAVFIDRETQKAKNGDNYKKMRDQWSKLIPEFRILCLSEKCDIIPMWSHYSESHKGAVIELQYIKELDSPWRVAKPIVYQGSPPVLATEQEQIKSITGQKPLDSKNWEFYEPYMLTKTTDWKHEKEWRIVYFMRPGESGYYSDYRFNPREIRSIYLGCEISDGDANDIISLLNYDLSHVRTYKARRLEHERKLSFERIK